MKKLVIIALSLSFVIGGVTLATAKFGCTVESVEGNTLVLKNCDAKKAAKLKAGDGVSITKKRKKLEGC